MEYVRAAKPADVVTDGVVYAGDSGWLSAGERPRDSVAGEAVRGWRIWLVVHVGDQTLLRSARQWTFWRPRFDLLATCDRQSERLLTGARLGEHTAPLSSCKCGISACREAEQALSYLSFAGPSGHRLGAAFGEVALWGEVLETPDGWRASHAYPTRLLLPTGAFESRDLAEAASHSLGAYDVPVQIVPATNADQLLTVARY